MQLLSGLQIVRAGERAIWDIPSSSRTRKLVVGPEARLTLSFSSNVPSRSIFFFEHGFFSENR